MLLNLQCLNFKQYYPYYLCLLPQTTSSRNHLIIKQSKSAFYLQKPIVKLCTRCSMHIKPPNITL